MADDDLLVRTSVLLIGVATASLQIEGGDRNNTWYDWSQLPGTIADGTFPGVPVNDLGWEVYPQGLVEVARALHTRHPGPIWVTENGTADAADAFRARFVHEHLAAMAGSGLPFERYYHWCFVDNWEWAQGEEPRFGIVALDYGTQERTVRDSGRFLSAVIRDGGVTRATYQEFVAGQNYPVGP